MSRNQKLVALFAAGLLSAMLTFWSYRSAIYAGLPWDWQGFDYRKEGRQLDDSFVRGQQVLLSDYALIWAGAAAVGGVASGAFLLRFKWVFSRIGCAGFMWPAFVMPLVGWLGFLSLILTCAAGVLPLAVIVQAARRRIRRADLLVVPFYLALLFFIHKFAGDWFSVFGD